MMMNPQKNRLPLNHAARAPRSEHDLQRHLRDVSFWRAKGEAMLDAGTCIVCHHPVGAHAIGCVMAHGDEPTHADGAIAALELRPRTIRPGGTR